MIDGRSLCLVFAVTLASGVLCAFPRAANAQRGPGAGPHATGGSITPPLANGDTFDYTITTTSTDYSPGKKPESTATTATVVETVVYPVTFEHRHDVYEIMATTNFSSNALPVTSETYVQFVPNGSFLDEIELAYNYQTEIYSGNEYLNEEQQLGSGSSGPFILNEYPDTAGTTWTQNVETQTKISATSSGLYPSTYSYNTTQASGAYTEVDGYSFGSSEESTTKYDVRANGTGTYLFSSESQPTVKYDFALPTQKGAGYVIPVRSEQGLTDVRDWYPGNSTPPAPLSNTVLLVGRRQLSPAACGADAGLAVNKVNATASNLDPVRGSYTTSTNATFVSETFGTVCALADQDARFYANTTTGKLSRRVVTRTLTVLTGETLGSAHVGRRAAAVPVPRLRS